MSIQTRRERERVEREQLIIRAARELAEAEGWDAVTTRRLAAEIDYSQPVLYSHFKGKDAIMTAVATEGFAELAGELHAAADSAPSPRAALAATAAAYAAFAEHQPALYDAMFTHAVDLRFGTPETPAPLRDGFAVLYQVIAPLSGDDDPETLTEIFWSSLHGLLTLMRSGRLRPDRRDHRLALLIARFSPPE
jgi:AcrR family transcriptional regulator